MKSLNIVFPEKQRVELQTQSVEKLENDELLCESVTSLVSIGTEMYCYRGLFDVGTNWADWVKYPFNTGYNSIGRVIEKGSDVKGYDVGDLVFTFSPHCQFFKVKQDFFALRKIPTDITTEEAIWVHISSITQVGVRRAELELGESVAVVGLGMIGLLVVQYLNLMGMRNIVAIDTDESRLELAKKFGATDSLALSIQDAKTSVSEITKNKMLDVVFDVTGNPSVLQHTVHLLRKMGRVVVLGDTPTPSLQSVGSSFVFNCISLLGCHGSLYPAVASEFNKWTYYEMNTLFFDFIRQGRLNTKDMNTHVFSPEDAVKVYTDLAQDRSKFIGILIDWTKLK